MCAFVNRCRLFKENTNTNFPFLQDPSNAAVGLDSLLLIKLLLSAKVSIKQEAQGLYAELFSFFVYFKCCSDFLLYFYKCSTSMAFT